MQKSGFSWSGPPVRKVPDPHILHTGPLEVLPCGIQVPQHKAVNNFGSLAEIDGGLCYPGALRVVVYRCIVYGFPVRRFVFHVLTSLVLFCLQNRAFAEIAEQSRTELLRVWSRPGSRAGSRAARAAFRILRQGWRPVSGPGPVYGSRIRPGLFCFELVCLLRPVINLTIAGRI